jgi:serine/threonine-protein kinase HipA
LFEVYLYDFPIGLLTSRGRGIRFRYAPDALDNDALPALSLALPKTADPFPDSKAGPFFRNLLPEQAYRRLVAAAAGTTPENSIALLGAIGGECPGAVSIWPSDAGPPDVPNYRRLTLEEITGLFSSGDRIALANAVTRGRLSLPGVQQKIALLREEDESWYLPLKGAVTSHILKQATPTFANLLENELFCMALASAIGLEVATTGFPAANVRVFSAERFDRLPSRFQGGPARRKLHQEDFCQILSIEPDRKYEFDGGPSLKKCAAVIRRHSALPAEDLERLVRWVGFNYLIGNEDAHAKNLALLYREDGLRLTPHYDLVSTEVYPELERNLAMKIGAAADIRNVQASDWKRLATAVALPWSEVREWLLQVMARVRSSVPATIEECTSAYGEAGIYSLIAAVIGQRGQQLERELSRNR